MSFFIYSQCHLNYMLDDWKTHSAHTMKGSFVLVHPILVCFVPFETRTCSVPWMCSCSIPGICHSFKTSLHALRRISRLQKCVSFRLVPLHTDSQTGRLILSLWHNQSCLLMAHTAMSSCGTHIFLGQKRTCPWRKKTCLFVLKRSCRSKNSCRSVPRQQHPF